MKVPAARPSPRPCRSLGGWPLLLLLAACGVGPAPAEPAELVGHEWRLLVLHPALAARLDAAEGPLGGFDTQTLRVAADGTASGSTGVNRWTARLDRAALDDGVFRLGPIAATRRAGTPRAMAAEALFLELLERARRFAWTGVDVRPTPDRPASDGRGLQLVDADGQWLATFERTATAGDR